jgi:hypothetical protein
MRITAMLTIQTKYATIRPTPTQASAELERLAKKMCDIEHSSSPCNYINFKKFAEHAGKSQGFIYIESFTFVMKLPS